MTMRRNACLGAAVAKTPFMFRLRSDLLVMLCTLLLGALAVSCRALPGQANRPALPVEIQNRTTNHFQDVVLLKPTSRESEASPIAQLAPLLIQTATTTNPSALWHDYPAPQVQAHKDIVLLNNRWHWQYTYTWNYPTGPQRIQGVRLTLDSRDNPVIWEILADTSGRQIIYVSQALELAARAEFGSPLPGRKFSIERTQKESPEIVLANVIEDGPLAMGPILYLADTSHDVLALICRCMPAQFQNLRDQRDYELLPPAPEQPGKNPFPPTRLDQALRLPGRF